MHLVVLEMAEEGLRGKARPTRFPDLDDTGEPSGPGILFVSNSDQYLHAGQLQVLFF